MSDRVTKIREALRFAAVNTAEVSTLWDAARDYADLLESGALIIQKGANGQWSKSVVDTFQSTTDPRWALDILSEVGRGEA